MTVENILKSASHHGNAELYKYDIRDTPSNSSQGLSIFHGGLGESSTDDDSVIRGGIPSGLSSSSIGTQTRQSSSSQTPGFGDFTGKAQASVGTQTGGINKSAGSISGTSADVGTQVGGKNNSFLHGLVSNAANLASFGLSRSLAAHDQGKATQLHSQNASAHGVGLNAAISTIDANQQSRIASGTAGATIGSLLGPLGSLAGYAIGHHFAPQADSPKISGFTGQFSPNNSGVANAHTTASQDTAPILSNG